jgi:uncharacterized membrane-anchored protein
MTASKYEGLPPDHPQRDMLSNEAHARPPEALPQRVSIAYLAMLNESSIEPVRELCRMMGKDGPDPRASHFSQDMGRFRLKWERHTEFVRFKFFQPWPAGKEYFRGDVLSALPKGWLSSLKGEILVADHVEVDLLGDPPDPEALSIAHFGGNPLIGSNVAGGLGQAFTDFRIHADGFGRILVLAKNMTERQRGRTVQRLVEIDTYRMMSLLTFPIARELMPQLGEYEKELNRIAETMHGAEEAQEPELLDRLMLLHARVVQRQTASQFRFSAATAYSELVSVRIAELREARIEGLQTFAEFTERRLTPAMKTCEAAANRLNDVSEKVARGTQLLSTKVNLTREKQNQTLLESMDSRARLQLRLQETVEGLSVAAITYYLAGLLAYVVAGLAAMGLIGVKKEVVVLFAIPLIVLLVALGVRRVRSRIMGQGKD